MNATRNLIINFCINGKHDHFINHPKDKHVQPHQPKLAATKPYKLYHKKGDNDD